MHLQPEGAGRDLQVRGLAVGRGIARIDESGNDARGGDHLLQHLHPLLNGPGREHVAHAHDVAARSVEGRDKSSPDRIGPDIENDRNRSRRRLGRQCRSFGRRGNHAHLTTNQIGRQFRQSIVLVVRPAIFDGHVFALDMAGLAQALAERANTVGVLVARCEVEEPDHRHRLLLRPRRERPCGRRAAEKRNEIPPPHGVRPSGRGPHPSISLGERSGVQYSKMGPACRRWVKGGGLAPVQLPGRDVRSTPASGPQRRALLFVSKEHGGLSRRARPRHSPCAPLTYLSGSGAPSGGASGLALPTPPATAGIVFDGDEGRLSEEAFVRDFAGDLPEAKAKVLYAVQEPFHKALLSGKTTHAAWRSKPSYYAVSTEDRTINPDLERFMAKRMGAKTIEVKASHLSLISHPDEITRLILEAAGQQT